MPALTLAAGLPFHYSELNDPRGSYLGTTFTGGNVIFDLFHKDKKGDSIMQFLLDKWVQVKVRV